MNQLPLDVNKKKHARIIKGKFKIKTAHERHRGIVAKLFLNLKSNNFVSDVNYQNNQVGFQITTRSLIGSYAESAHLIGQKR